MIILLLFTQEAAGDAEHLFPVLLECKPALSSTNTQTHSLLVSVREVLSESLLTLLTLCSTYMCFITYTCYLQNVFT